MNRFDNIATLIILMLSFSDKKVFAVFALWIYLGIAIVLRRRGK